MQRWEDELRSPTSSSLLVRSRHYLDLYLPLHMLYLHYYLPIRYSIDPF
jgi:hypothetical protein